MVNAELAEQASHPHQNDQFAPYGTGNTVNSPIIALGEAWGYHIGHFLADQRYGVNASCKSEQGPTSCPNPPTFTNHPEILVLENYDPNSPADPFKWIPKGLMEDLIDNTPNEVLVNDQVYGYTIGALFAALQSDVTSLQQYKARLLQQNNNYQQVQTNDLFTSYHY